jgi:hypothetical protein
MMTTMYCIHLTHTHRHVSPHPMHIFVVTQPNQHQLNYPQVFWATPIEQLPPTYNTMIPSTDTNYNIIHETNES